MKKYTAEMEATLKMLKKNPLKGAKMVVSLLNSKNDTVKLEATVYILDRVLGKSKIMRETKRKNST